MCRHSYLFDGFFILTIGAVVLAPFQGVQALQSPVSMDSDGIDAYVLHHAPYHLTGKKIAIGQVEPGRPGLFGFDKKVAPQGMGLPLAGLFFRNKSASQNTHVDSHAHSVASLMVSQSKMFTGIAPAARLYSAALGSRRTGAKQPEQCLTLSHVAQQNGGDIRAINLSFGESLRLDRRVNAKLDGNALLTQCLDWSARVHDTLYAVAGNQGKGGIPIPTDQYNGVTVAYTRFWKGSFRKVDFANMGDEMASLAYRFIGKERNMLGRSSVSLVAPGNDIRVLRPNGDPEKSSGTSFAAPHVTATVALLQEAGDRTIRQNLALKNDPSVGQASRPSFMQSADTSSRRHEVMKAILLNSADKLQDNGQGLRLGMTKTILGQDNRDWLQSPAANSRIMPLDPLMGAGQLNARRAHQQLMAGRQLPRSAPAQGWDYGQVGAIPETLVILPHQDYTIAQPLQAGSYFSATLAWDRRVELVDVNRNDRYDIGERFRDRGLNNLDLYLMRAEDDKVAQAIWSSTSTVDSVEHIFKEIPATGRYKLRVLYRDQKNEPSQAYGLAWWGMPVAN